jgi:hypothetical protein
MAEDNKFAGIELLDTHNYGTWSFRMKNLLVSKGLATTLDGLPDTATAADRDIDKKALSYIGLCVKEHHIATIRACTTAKAAWDALSAVHQSKTVSRRLQLRRELNSIKKTTAEPLSVFFFFWSSGVTKGEAKQRSKKHPHGSHSARMAGPRTQVPSSTPRQHHPQKTPARQSTTRRQAGKERRREKKGGSSEPKQKQSMAAEEAARGTIRRSGR